MNEIDYNALFGEKEPEPAEPAESEGEKEQDVAEPAVEKEEQDKETNAMYAAARRKAERERDAAVEDAERKAKEAADKYIAEAFKSSGLTNPYTGAAITSREEYEAYKASADKERTARVMDSSGMSEAEFERFVDELPAVREARAAKEEADKIKNEAREAEIKADIERQVAEITALDPSIKSLVDLTRLESYPEIYEKVGKGYSIVDAYKLTNMDKVRDAAAKAAKQDMRNAESKSHLTRTEGRGKGSVSVPADVMAEYRLFNPNATEAEISAHYNKHIKN